jgi:hypothetical protein
VSDLGPNPYACGVQTPQMKGPCVKWKHHVDYADRHHRAATPVNEETPRLRQFRRIVEVGLDNGVQLSYVEIAELMDHPNVRSVASYGLGSRYTKLRQRIFAERGIEVDNHRRSVEQSAKIVEDVRMSLIQAP